jgi:hypothetical protein
MATAVSGLGEPIPSLDIPGQAQTGCNGGQSPLLKIATG